MTYLRRIAQLVEDLRELNVIQKKDQIQYYHFDAYQITISTEIGNNIEKKANGIRYGVIYQEFLDEFSPEEIFEKHCDYNEVKFVIRKICED